MGKRNWCRMLLLRPTSAMGCERDVRAGVRAAVAARGVLAACVALALAACSGAPTKSDRASAAPDVATSSASAANANAGSQKSGSADVSATPGSASGTASLSAPADIPKRALSDFDRAVGLMKAGNSGEAELEFKTLAAGYPQLAG